MIDILTESVWGDPQFTTLTFKFKEGEYSGKTGRFEITDLRVLSYDPLDYDTVKLYIDDKEYQGEFSSWAKDHLDAVDLVQDILNEYLRDDFTNVEFLDGWNIFDEIKNKNTKVENGITTQIPQCPYDLFVYDLSLQTEDYKFYICDDMFLMLDAATNAIITDEEFFFNQAFYEEAEKIYEGELKPIYSDENLRSYIEAEFGE